MMAPSVDYYECDPSLHYPVLLEAHTFTQTLLHWGPRFQHMNLYVAFLIYNCGKSGSSGVFDPEKNHEVSPVSGLRKTDLLLGRTLRE